MKNKHSLLIHRNKNLTCLLPRLPNCANNDHYRKKGLRMQWRKVDGKLQCTWVE